MALFNGVFPSRVLAKYSPRMGIPFEEYYLSRTASPFQFFPRERDNFYSEQMLHCVDRDRTQSVTRRYLERGADYSLINKMLYVDTHTWLPDELLIKADKMTMANSVELRVPLLDHKVLEFAATLPRNQKVRGWTMKYLLKKALRGRVPDEILFRRKAGFPVPYEGWLRDELRGLVGDMLLDQRALSRGYFKRNALEQLIKLNRDGVDYSKEVFSLVVLELWHRAFVDKTTHQPERTETAAFVQSQVSSRL